MKQGNSMAANLVAQRGNRCSASILGWLEANLYPANPEISTQTQKAIRQTILDNVNSFKDLSIDIVKSETAVMNDVWVQKLDEIHREIKNGR
jgi:hypothetical protein